MKRVLLAGLFHETHTFLEGVTPLEEFQSRSGADLIGALGDGSPLGGALEAAIELGWEVLPVIDLRATPSATVEDRVVEVFWQAFEEVAEREEARGIDGIFLVLHGAMVSQSHRDVEGELLGRIRRRPALSKLPIAGVLDLHGNISPDMAALSNGLLAYEKNPHTDAEKIARRAVALLDRLIENDERPTTVWEQPSVIWPPPGTATSHDPMLALEDMARSMASFNEHILAVNVFAGFSFSDTEHTGVSFTAITLGDPEQARPELRRLSTWAIEHREEGNAVEPPIESIMTKALSHSAGPVLLVEPADNIGGGAPGDGTGVLRALLRHSVDGGVVVINDPDAVSRLDTAVIGETLRLAIGGKASPLSGGSVELDVEFRSRSDGQFLLEDRQSHLASMGGTRVSMGPSAVVRHAGIDILLTTRRTPPFDLGQLRSQGIEPTEKKIIGVKAAVAHRRAYDPIAVESYTVDTPGPCSSNLKSFPYRHVRRPVFPLDS